MLCDIVLYCGVLYYVVLCCVLLYFIVLYCMVLYCIALHCVALYACEHHTMIHIHTPIYHKHNPQTQDTTRTQAARDDLQARLQDLD